MAHECSATSGSHFEDPAVVWRELQEVAMIGQIISHYNILEKLGEGGMGIVYKAQDTRLDRLVALKFLPEHVSVGSADLERFTQEAKAAAGLNHPNICTIHGIEESEGKNFIVMEFVDGQTLQEKKSSLSMKQALDTGIQIAEGLAAAHEKGIVHRDIKPENIMIRKDGRVQIMDFGLAKLRRASRLTKEGSTVGTAGYMSPEQVQGQETDHRSDIFSLGVLLYEMLSGQPPFKGMHETAIAYEIVNVDPQPLTSVKPGVDSELDQIVADCMAKDPADRYQSAAEVARNIRRIRKDSGTKTKEKARDPSRTMEKEKLRITLERGFWIAGIILLSAAILLISFRQQEPNSVSTLRFTVPPPENTTPSQIAMSPKGEYLALTATGGGKTLLWIRPLHDIGFHSLAGTDGAAHPFWSPDGQFVGFFAGGKLKRVSPSGGSPITICDAPDGRGGAWNQQGTILFAPTSGGVIYSVPASGGTPRAITTLDTSKRETHHIWPAFLPDGDLFAYSSRRYDHDRSVIHLASLSSGYLKPLLIADANAGIASPGFLVFLKERTLMAQHFDFSQGVLSGDPVAIADNVDNIPLFGLAGFSTSLNGVLAIGGGRSTKRQFAWFDRQGRLIGTVGPPGNYFDINISPDHTRAAIQFTDVQTDNSDIWIIYLKNGAMSRFTFQDVVDDNPVWSPDGESIIYVSRREGNQEVYLKSASGKGQETRVPVNGDPYSWSRDGRFLLFNAVGTLTRDNVMVLPFKPAGEPFPYLDSEAGEVYPQFSPDGKWVAYVSNETGRFEVYVQSFPRSGGKWQISTGGGSQPRWREDGKELFFISAAKAMMAVEVQTGTTFKNGTPRQLFDTQIDNYDAPNRYAVAGNGQRFLINVPAGQESANPITIVAHWTNELRSK
jgi:serine/threonine protein kinase